MKKSIIRTLSLVLVLVLAVSALSVTAFAAEVEPCASCTHPNAMVTPGVRYVDNGSNHLMQSVGFCTCATCGAHFVKVYSSTPQSHVYSAGKCKQCGAYK